MKIRQEVKLFLIISESVDCLVCSDEDLRRNILTDFASIIWLTVSIHIYIWKTKADETALRCQKGEQCTWQALPNKLQISREYHLQFTVPAKTIPTC